ncbi:MAG: aldehyde dehydrogenase family protein, partial [Reyranella sp.]
DGHWLDSGEHLNSINPATGEPIGRYAKGGVLETLLAVEAARRAFRTTDWKHDRARRARVLNAMAGRFEALAEPLSQALGAEVGKILPHARFEVSTVAPNLRFNAALALTDHGRAAETGTHGLSMVIREPVGVAGIFAPWNAPIALGIRSLAPALAAGCTATVVLPQRTAQINALVAEVIAGAEGLPAGIVNVVTGGRECIAGLVESPDVPVISFTGSTKIGREISAAGAVRLKRFGLELGGKAPMIVFDDADLVAVLDKVVAGLIVFAGQFCMTGSRAIVQKGISERFRAALADRLGKVRVGPASEASSDMGPLIDRANVARVDQMVEDAIAAGARVVVRGGPATDGPLARGAFYRPTLLEVADSSLPIVQQEVFGPVLTMQVFDTEAEAVALANHSEYGLSASVWSRDVDRPLRVARAVQAGTVWINDWATIHDQFEEGGYKQSGRGRLRGASGLDDFLECKHIAFSPGAIAR